MKMTNVLNKIKKSVTYGVTGATTLALTTINSLAAEGAAAAGAVKGLIEKVVEIGCGIGGGVFLVIGAVKMITAYHNNQPQEMHAALKDIVVGACFLALAILIAPFLGLF